MFAWIKKCVGREHDKLLHQNYAAASQFHTSLTMLGGDMNLLLHLATIREMVPDGGEIPQRLLPSLLQQNKDLRRLYDTHVANGPEARVKRAMGIAYVPPSFDDAFVPHY